MSIKTKHRFSKMLIPIPVCRPIGTQAHTYIMFYLYIEKRKFTYVHLYTHTIVFSQPHTSKHTLSSMKNSYTYLTYSHTKILIITHTNIHCPQ